ncbi:hypothetical protein KIN20_028330 [Parelaphostrongylus tenuis]|uniref:Uncharacterized protein n=1 Tax=Parelaphostrongylus tenuis TaxID=148309 RepID=A0AAD5R0Y6_PARTN|nr:hypothetical protein KIN20_028330 [Parelaphostrongylus tenuis]
MLIPRTNLLQCLDLKPPGSQGVMIESCIFVGSTVTGICPGMSGAGVDCAMVTKAYRRQTLVPLRSSHCLKRFS